MTEQPSTPSAPGDQPQTSRRKAVGSLRPRVVTLIVVAALVAGTLVGVIATRLSRPDASAPQTDAPQITSFVAGLTSGGSGRVGPWSLTLSDFTVVGPADRPDRFVVTVDAQNAMEARTIDNVPADLAKLRFFDAIRADQGSSSTSSRPTMIDCAPEDGSPLPRTGLIAPGATATGRVCLTGWPANSMSPGPLWVHISAYVADLNLLERQTVLHGVSGEGQTTSSPDWWATVTNIRREGAATHITTVTAVKPSPRHRGWLATVAVTDPDFGAPECQPGSGFHPFLTIPDTSTNLTGGISELCVHGGGALSYGYLPRVFWDIPYPHQR